MAALCNGVGAGDSLRETCKNYDLRAAYTPPRIYDSNNNLVFDGYYLQPPLCILCLRPSTISNPFMRIDKRQLDITDVLRHSWLYWLDSSTSKEVPASLKYIGEAGGRRFYALSHEEFANFVLTTLPLPASPPRSPEKIAEKPPPKGGPPPPRAPLARPEVPTGVVTPQIPGSIEGGSLRQNFPVVPQILPNPPQ
jgi:hypothetical protein